MCRGRGPKKPYECIVVISECGQEELGSID